MNPIPGPERGTNHLLRAGFPARTGDGNDRRALGQHAPPGARQLAQRDQRVIDLEVWKPVDRRRAAPHDGRGGTLRLRLRQEVVCVEVLALQGHKQGIGYRGSGVGGDRAELELGGRRYTKRFCDLVGSPRMSSHYTAPNARTTSRSSNGSLVVPMT